MDKQEEFCENYFKYLIKGINSLMRKYFIFNILKN